MAKKQYEVIGRVTGHKVGQVVSFEGDLPRVFKGRVRALPEGVAVGAVDAARAEAEKIVADAKAEAEQIIADAKTQAAPPPPKK